MKKKLSSAEKYELQLRYHFKELKRANLIEKSLPLKEFRKSGLALTTEKTITVKTRSGGKITRHLTKFNSVKKLVKEGYKKPVKKVKVSREARKAQNRRVRHFALLQRQKFKLLRKLKKNKEEDVAKESLRKAA